MNLITKARHFAIEAHGGQKRKYDGLPYWTHLRDVAFILQEGGYFDFMVAAGWLHDAIEDTNVTENDLRAEFPDEVVRLVVGLTDVSRPREGNRAHRKALDRAHLAGGCGRIQTIKCVDLICNTRDIAFIDHPEANSFAPTYLAEKRLLLDAMIKAEPAMKERAWNVLFTAERIIHSRTKEN